MLEEGVEVQGNPQRWDGSSRVSETLHRRETRCTYGMLLSYTRSRAWLGEKILQSDGDVDLGSICCRMI